MLATALRTAPPLAAATNAKRNGRLGDSTRTAGTARSSAARSAAPRSRRRRPACRARTVRSGSSPSVPSFRLRGFRGRGPASSVREDSWPTRRAAVELADQVEGHDVRHRLHVAPRHALDTEVDREGGDTTITSENTLTTTSDRATLVPAASASVHQLTSLAPRSVSLSGSTMPSPGTWARSRCPGTRRSGDGHTPRPAAAGTHGTAGDVRHVPTSSRLRSSSSRARHVEAAERPADGQAGLVLLVARDEVTAAARAPSAAAWLRDCRKLSITP